MLDSCRCRHDRRDVLVEAEGGQSTPGQPDRDTESITGVDLATDTLDVGDIQPVKHVESNPQCRLISCPTELWNALMIRLWWGMWAGQAACEAPSAERLDGSGAASPRTAGRVTRCCEKARAKELGHGHDVRQTRRTWIAEACLNSSITR